MSIPCLVVYKVHNIFFQQFKSNFRNMNNCILIYDSCNFLFYLFVFFRNPSSISMKFKTSYQLRVKLEFLPEFFLLIFYFVFILSVKCVAFSVKNGNLLNVHHVFTFLKHLFDAEKAMNNFNL